MHWCKRILFGLSVVIVPLAFDIYRTPVPPESSEPSKIKSVLYLIKLFGLKTKIHAYLAGYEKAFLSFSQSAQSDASAKYTAKPDRTEDGILIKDRTFNNVPVRLYEPENREKFGGAVVYYHGGGWTLGSVEAYEPLVKDMATDLNMLVVSVEYRLAPDHPFPVPMNDCYDATLHFLENAEEFEVDPQRISLAGDSAGGNLAASVSLRLRDMKIQHQPNLQVLIYPATQSVDFMVPSYVANQHDPILNKRLMIAFWMAYAGNLKFFEDAMNNEHITSAARSNIANYINHEIITGKTGSTPAQPEGKQEVWNSLKEVLLNPYFAPLMAEDLSGLPQAFVYTCIQDVLQNDGLLYAERLKKAGNNVTYYLNKAGFHGINSFVADFKDTKDSMKLIRDYIKDNL